MLRRPRLLSCRCLRGFAALLALLPVWDANADTTTYQFNFGANGESTWENAVQSIHDAGFNDVSISPVRFVQVNSNQNPGSIAQSSTRGPELSHIAAGVARAKALGMRVTLNPFVEPVDGTNYFSYWRGQYNPRTGTDESSRFWNDYEDYLVEVAELGQTYGADAMNVGTELKAITQNSRNSANWTSAIAAVDNVFDGLLGYAANWDNFRNANLTNTIWNNPSIDYMGVDSYFRNLVSNATADASGDLPNESFIGEIETAWNSLLDNNILAFAAEQKSGDGMPVELTEVGYLPYNRTSVNPQNSSGSIDQDEQTMTFMGLMRALDGRLDELTAAHIWQWGMPGSNGSLWNMNTTNANQPNNVQTTQWLSDFISNPSEFVDGDFNDDGAFDCADIDALTMAIAGGEHQAAFDLDGDGLVDVADRDAWLVEAGVRNLASGNSYVLGDANLDGVVDVSDFNVWNSNKFSNTAAWCSGDFSADGSVDVSDFNIWNSNKFQSSDAAAVPEPSCATGFMLASILCMWFRRRIQRCDT